MEIIDKLNKSQFNELKEIYADFFKSINFDNEYSSYAIKLFARRKAIDAFRAKQSDKYFFCIENERIIGFIHGKITDNIGLISHVYVKCDYRNTMIFATLYKSLIEWFKDKNVQLVEIEVNKENPILNNIERNNWQIVREFDDANVYQRRI